MRIAVWHNLPSGGGKRALYNHVKGLVEMGHHVEVWCPTTANTQFLPLSEFAKEHIVPIDWDMTPEPNQVKRVMRARWYVPRKITAMNEHCRRCADEIHAGHFDILFANSCWIFYAPAIGRHVNLPKVLYLQEPARMLYEASPRLPWAALENDGRQAWNPKHWTRLTSDFINVNLLRLQVREELRNAGAFDKILVNSLFSRENVLRTYNLDASVCYLGIDTQKFKPMNVQRENFVIGVGAFSASKRIDFVIEALGRVKERRPKLVWVGNTGKSEYMSRLKQLALDQSVELELKLNIEDNELAILLNQALAMVYAPRLEPFGFVPLEANACGLPVIGVAEGGLRETIIDGFNGYLVDPEPAAMASCIEKLIAQPDLVNTLGKNGQNRVATLFSLEAANRRLGYYLNESRAKHSAA
jgi:glycosyltransferase involved in cell wall biosynthesis